MADHDHGTEQLCTMSVRRLRDDSVPDAQIHNSELVQRSARNSACAFVHALSPRADEHSDVRLLDRCVWRSERTLLARDICLR